MSKKIEVLITNRVARFSEPYPYEDMLPYFSFHPPGYRFMPSFRRGGWDGKIRMLKYHKTPTGLFLSLRKQLEEELGVEFNVTKEFQKVKFKEEGITSDRDFQNECVEKMIAATNRWGGGLILNATGSGKTFIAAMYFSRLIGSACFVVDELTLLYQAQMELSAVLGEQVGMIGKSEFLPQRITVATVQTLALHIEDKKFMKWSEKLSVMIIDELHQAMSKRNFTVVEESLPPAVFGLTATLELQKKHIRMKAHALTGPVVFEYPLARGQAEGFLAPAIAVQILYDNPDPENWDEKYKKWRGNYQEQLKQFIIWDDTRNDIICQLVKLARVRKKFVVVLVERIQHLEILSDLLEGIPHRVVCGKKEVEKRLSDIEKFEEGKVRVILANKVFKKGINIKKLDVIVDGAGMKNSNDPQQKLGRGVRLAEGKEGLLYFDIGDVGNRYEVGAKRRRKALRALQIPFKKVRWEGDVEKVFRTAEGMLQKVTQGNLFESK